MKTTISVKVFRNAVLLFVFFAVMLLGAQKAKAAFKVFVSIPPQKWLSDRIGGQHLATSVLISKGQDPPPSSQPRNRWRRLAVLSSILPLASSLKN